MTTTVRHTSTQPPHARPPGQERLLMAGAAAGIFFIVASFAQLPLNPGFDLSRNAFSFLTLGPAGWLQQGVFIITGILSIGGAVGLSRAVPGRSRIPATVFAALVGVGEIIAGLCRPDPAFGYPKGAPAGIPEHVSAASVGHGIGFSTAVVAWVVLLVVLGIGLRRNRGIAIGAPLLAAALLVVPAVEMLPWGTIYLYVSVSVGFVATSAIYVWLARSQVSPGRSGRQTD